jgi:hypothetical protein
VTNGGRSGTPGKRLTAMGCPAKKELLSLDDRGE